MNNDTFIKINERFLLQAMCILLVVGFIQPSITYATKKNIYRSDKHSYSIVYPTGWERKSARMKNTDFIASSPKGANITIVVRESPDKSIESFNSFTDTELNLLIDNNITEHRRKYKNVVVNAKGLTNLHNEKSIWMNLTYTDSTAFDSTFRFRVLIIQTLYNNKFYAITCLNESKFYQDTERECKNSINSFVFEDRIYPRGN